MWITKVLTQKYFIMDKQGNYCFSHEGQKKKQNQNNSQQILCNILDGKSYYISNECLNSKGAEEGVL